jgi:RecA-family ATPase
MQAQQESRTVVPEEFRLTVVNAYEIYVKDLPPTKWYVGEILQEGATLLSGDPKVGKSFLALQIAIAVAGRSDQVCGSLSVGTHGRVLYLALDDGSEKRIHERLHQLTTDEEAVKNIDFVYQRHLRNLSDGFLEDLERVMAGGGYVMVILDTLGAVLGLSSAKNIYRQEYQEAIKLQKLAQKYGCSLLIIHHTNKGEGKDAVQRASGSHGLTGAVDSVMLLGGDGNGKGVLHARPRDGESSEYQLDRDEDGGWRVTGRVESFTFTPAKRLTPEMEAVKIVLADGPKSREQVAAALGIGDEATRKRLERMERKGLIRRTPEFLYEWVA